MFHIFQKIHILLVIIAFYTNICLATIITTNNFKIIEDHVKSADLNTLIIFDIDHVLLQPKDCSLRPYYNDTEHKKAKNFFDKINNQLTVEEQSQAIMLMQVEPVDPDMVKLINSLQNRAVKVLALTARDTGKFGKISSMDKFHTAKIKAILKEHGWITISKFGKEADQQASTLVQHADHDPFFQAGCAFVLEKLVKSGETNQQNYAYLYDRAMLQFQNLGLKQKYGTQAINNNGHITLLPYDGNINELNKRRKSINLDSVDKYLKQLKNMYIVE